MPGMEWRVLISPPSHAMCLLKGYGSHWVDDTYWKLHWERSTLVTTHHRTHVRCSADGQAMLIPERLTNPVLPLPTVKPLSLGILSHISPCSLKLAKVLNLTCFCLQFIDFPYYYAWLTFLIIHTECYNIFNFWYLNFFKPFLSLEA